MGASSVNQGRVIVAVPTPPALWFYTVHCVTVWPGVGGGGPRPRAEHNYSILIASPWGTSPCGQVLAQQVQWVDPSLLTWTPPPSLPTVTIINSWLKNPSKER